MATTNLGLKTFGHDEPIDFNDWNDNLVKIDTAVGEAKRWKAAYNHIVNSNFRINQRGTSSYSGNGYAVDMFELYKWSSDGSATVSLSVKSDGVVLYGGVSDVTTPSACYLYQKIDCTGMVGKTLTAAVYIDSLSGAGTGIIGAYNGSTYIRGATLKAGVNVVSFTVPTDATKLVVRVGNDSSHAGKGSITASIKWIALYEGAYTADTLPAYVPKGYAAELLACQRYFYRVSNTIIGPAYGSAGGGTVYFALTVPTEMRVTPSVSVSVSYLIFRTVDGDYQLLPSDVSVVSRQGNIVQLMATNSSVPARAIGSVYCGPSTILTLSAEI